MATYVIGDVQGCFESLMELVGAIQFDRARDELIFVGDLVNRGPKNLETLRWIRDLGEGANVVLGNHDVHFLARAAGAAESKHLDTLEDVLDAPDLDDLTDWLRRRPFLIERKGDVIVHAGLLPSWSVADATSRANELSAGLAGDDWKRAVGELRSGGTARRRESASVFVRVRMLDEAERLVNHKGPPQTGPRGARAWFEWPHKRGEVRVIVGHWSALGLLVRPDIVCLDTGCVWGRSLSALCLERGTVTSVPAAEH